MPTYEYACKFCKHEFETFQSIKDEPLRRCPACKKMGLKRLISGGAGIIFKGSGFYETDYRRSSEKPKSESDAKPASTSTDKKPAAEKSTDAKPAPASAAKPETSKTSAPPKKS